jgi:hypothetical protein
MAGGCRDCPRCTETTAAGCVLGVFRMLIWAATFWNIGLFMKKCPQCGHRLSIHQRRADGSFRD